MRVERSRLCIYAFIERQVKDQEVKDRVETIASIRNDSTCVPENSSVKKQMNIPISCKDGA